MQTGLRERGEREAYKKKKRVKHGEKVCRERGRSQTLECQVQEKVSGEGRPVADVPVREDREENPQSWGPCRWFPVEVEQTSLEAHRNPGTGLVSRVWYSPRCPGVCMGGPLGSPPPFQVEGVGSLPTGGTRIVYEN